MLKEKFTENLIYSQFFSFEVLEYFDSIATEENVNWIEKYFNVLMKSENESATKYNEHHIRPCCTFKDKEHKNRKQTQSLGDAFNGNIIKVSISNHIRCHYFLWKIYPNNIDIRRAVWRMCGKGKIYGNKLTEEELEECAKMAEECAKENRTDEEKKERRKERYWNDRDGAIQRVNEWVNANPDKVKKNKDNWYRRSRENILKERKDNRLKYSEKERNYRHTHKDKVKERANRPCRDPIRKDICTWRILKHRKSRNKELYENIKLADCLIKDLIVIPQSNA